MELIGLGGTNGAGKDTVAEMLVERRGWLFVSLSELLRAEARKRGLQPTRQTLRDISSEWRRSGGLGVLVDKALEQYDPEIHPGLVVSSLRHPAEADRIHELAGRVVWVDADPRVRYERIVSRERDGEHHLTYEEFMADEAKEAQHGDDKATLNTSDVAARADIILDNGRGGDIEDFKATAQQQLFK